MEWCIGTIFNAFDDSDDEAGPGAEDLTQGNEGTKSVIERYGESEYSKITLENRLLMMTTIVSKLTDDEECDYFVQRPDATGRLGFSPEQKVTLFIAYAGAGRIVRQPGREKTSTVILEAVASQSLWIWHACYGMPAANNDLNVLERSPLLNDLVNGIAPQVNISPTQGNKCKCYAATEEAVRKDLERTFGVLQLRFRILPLPCKLWKVDAMNDMMLAMIVLHNMFVEDEMLFSSQTQDYLFEDNWVSPARMEIVAESPVTTIANALSAIEDERIHYELKKT
ncbi:hypothetical protein PHMEG_00016720 [Phytophthora megakarya]|uniref:DDE Tnp4 domain-containing protein n=1 Tax=Phytophthora megakarya TaxID=4795 RepID=A0A225VYA3_9STRA|nr:hypothetical protein PHMEG_00016720 [Phytophthora megakarya]